MALSHMVRRANDAFAPVEAAVDTFGVDVSGALTGMTGPFVPEGATNTDYAQLMGTQVAMSGAARGVVVVKGRAYNQTRSSKNKVGRTFRGSIDKVAGATRKLRNALREHYGPEVLAEIDLSERLRSRHTHTLTEVEHSVDLLRGLDLSSFEESEGLGALDVEARIQWIEKLLEASRKAKKRYELAVKKNDQAREALTVSAVSLYSPHVVT